MSTYTEKRYRNTKIEESISMIINDMNSNPKKWDAPTKTVFNRTVGDYSVSLIRNFYSTEEPIQLFVNQCEIETLTNKETRILAAEFGYLRQKFSSYISKIKVL